MQMRVHVGFVGLSLPALAWLHPYLTTCEVRTGTNTCATGLKACATGRSACARQLPRRGTGFRACGPPAFLPGAGVARHKSAAASRSTTNVGFVGLSLPVLAWLHPYLTTCEVRTGTNTCATGLKACATGRSACALQLPARGTGRSACGTQKPWGTVPATRECPTTPA
jgi:hypothetical protein